MVSCNMCTPESLKDRAAHSGTGIDQKKKEHVYSLINALWECATANILLAAGPNTEWRAGREERKAVRLILEAPGADSPSGCICYVKPARSHLGRSSWGQESRDHIVNTSHL
ncbi:hypothetical protein AV530_012315 [Patagioenas fasciata monilis]|uniref:Uncharacterized protein n=1 Tax=Patagioenas fasciata monilis TaxID=372326 RepID=A0A1V4JAV3_PATFA|nr:hypothetical protein AV530_012315 [Patagioenas fasciata monilis]